MNFEYKKYIACSIFLLLNQLIIAGPPFNTDDPEPVDFKHWEFYISSLNNHQTGAWSGTAPHFEINYGLVNNVQVHLLMPVNYLHPMHQGSDFGYADTELGVKFRFIQESAETPQVGIFPIVELPTVRNTEFGSGKPNIYLPVWIQKSWDKLTTYGGAGYWINPGSGNKNWVFAGWEIQYEFSSLLMLGGEVYYHTSMAKNNKSGTGFNVGGSVNPSEKMHLIFSLGHTFTGDHVFTSYIGLLWTI